MHKLVKKSLILASLSAALFTASARADMQNDMVNYFDSLGFSGNATSSSSYQGQQAGYYSTGSEYMRDSTSMLNLVQLTVPSLNAGCGGIDIFNGGFSFINSQALITFFENVMQNAAGYLFNLALKTEVPQISEALQEMEKLAQDMNNQNLSSCQMAQDMIGGLLPQTQASATQVCQDVGSQNNLFSDWTDARLQCGQYNNSQQAMKDASNDKTYQKIAPYDVNVIWQAIQNIDQFQNDNQLAEFAMSITGTIIFDDQGNSTQSNSILSDKMIKAMMVGGQSDLYVCDDSDFSKCLTIAKQSMTINAPDSFVKLTMKEMDAIEGSISNDTPLTDDEKSFLNLTTLPVFKLIEVNMQSGDEVDLSQYANAIAANILNNYLSQIVDAVKAGLGGTSYAPSITMMVENNVNAAKMKLNAMANQNAQSIQAAIDLINQSRDAEKAVAANVTNQTKNNMAWGP